jgi:imidazolonepropionase-like amidohydrolase
MLAAAGTRWVPTLAVSGRDALLLRDEPERLDDPRLRGVTPATFIRFSQVAAYQKDVSTSAMRGSWADTRASLAAAKSRGVLLGIGTDAPNPQCFFGASVHWELEGFVEAGLTPRQALALASQGGADTMGATDRGSLVPGQKADIVVLDRDPLVDIRNTQAIWRVVKSGWVFDPESLQARP